ncbi:MAG: GGDEF domain-containing protein [Coriobacteriales bacterium]
MSDKQDITPGIPSESVRKAGGIRLRAIAIIIAVVAAAIAAVFLSSVYATNSVYKSLDEASQDYILCEQATSDMKAGSNYLTIEVRTYVVTQDPRYLENYFWEADENKRRDKAIETFEEIQGTESSPLKSALEQSNELMGLELYAMRLVAESQGHAAEIAAHLSDVKLSAEDEALSPEGKIQKAMDMVFGDEYMGYVSKIEAGVSEAKEGRVSTLDELQKQNEEELDSLLVRQQALAILLFIVLVIMVIALVVLVLLPLKKFNKRITDNESLPVAGSLELRELAEAYNVMYEETMRNHDTLRRKAEHDHLTGLYNRSVFERVLQLHAKDHYGIMIVDADYFKSINDTLGHDKGDEVLKKLANLLSHTFRTTDYPCRIGGDEFAVFMTEMTEDLRYVVEAKAHGLRMGMQDESDGLPPVTLSIGVAFSDGIRDGSEIFKNADEALYKVKEAGRNGLGFYKPEDETAK